jgi:hypothetical protein
MANQKNNDHRFKPRTFFVELAEYGVLEDSLKTRFRDAYENDPSFKEYMQEILVKHSSKPVADIEALYLSNLCETLGYFLEYTSQWTKLKR